MQPGALVALGCCCCFDTSKGTFTARKRVTRTQTLAASGPLVALVWTLPGQESLSLDSVSWLLKGLGKWGRFTLYQLS